MEICNSNIPTITSKSEFQPPWFDSETYEMCRKKERLQAKFKISKYPGHYQQYYNCRRDLKNLIQKKIRATLNNVEEDDPTLISKKFWSHVKSMSNSSRIPETVSYKGSFRNNPKDQSEHMNIFMNNFLLVVFTTFL